MTAPLPAVIRTDRRRVQADRDHPAAVPPGAGPDLRRWLAAGGIAAVGCALLTARPALVAATGHPVALLTVLFVAVLATGAAWPLPAAARVRRVSWWGAVALGIGAFTAGRVLVGGHALAPASIGWVLANTLAAVAEEAWFRRFCFGLLAPAGTTFAVVGSAVLFAAVHVAVYGAWVLPLDLAAGLLLGWQRAATGSWGAAAVTHVAANLLVVL